MKKETYESQKPFAGPKKPSMLRRCVGHDYRGRQIYMITMVTEGRHPLFGRITGRSDAPPGAANAPSMELSELGRRVEEEWWNTTLHHPEIEVMALQMMPDHLHGILFVHKEMEKPLGMALRGFKQSCNKHYRELVLGLLPAAPSAALSAVPSVAPSAVSSVALPTQQTQPNPQQTQPNPQQTQPTAQQSQPAAPRSRCGEDRSHGLLFARGYNDRLLLREGQLERWLNYLNDNPRRLLLKREHPDLFRVQRNLACGPYSFSAIGNRFLLDRPLKLQVRCSRRLSEAEIQQRVSECLAAAQQGAVLVSPAISKGEKAVMRAAFDANLPLICLLENGFSELAKPGGKRMEACARGQLLLLAPWSHHNEKNTISRDQCLSLNEMARFICEG